MLNQINASSFYPVFYTVLNVDGELKLHFDFGDYSHSQKRTIGFNPDRVVHKGLIRHPLVYEALMQTLNSSKGGFDLNLYLDNLAEVIGL
jgi:hypothetical protein